MSNDLQPEIVDVNREALFALIAMVNLAVRLATAKNSNFEEDLGTLCTATRALSSRIPYAMSEADRRKVLDSMRRAVNAVRYWAEQYGRERGIGEFLWRGLEMLESLLPQLERGENLPRISAEFGMFFRGLYDTHIAPLLR